MLRRLMATLDPAEAGLRMACTSWIRRGTYISGRASLNIYHTSPLLPRPHRHGVVQIRYQGHQRFSRAHTVTAGGGDFHPREVPYILGNRTLAQG